MTKALMDTEAGLIELDLFDGDAPQTVANFTKLAKEGFYDGLSFHRVIDGFMAQGGCPNTREGANGAPEPVDLVIRSIVRSITESIFLAHYLWLMQARTLAEVNFLLCMKLSLI